MVDIFIALFLNFFNFNFFFPTQSERKRETYIRYIYIPVISRCEQLNDGGCVVKREVVRDRNYAIDIAPSIIARSFFPTINPKNMLILSNVFKIVK